MSRPNVNLPIPMRDVEGLVAALAAIDAPDLSDYYTIGQVDSLLAAYVPPAHAHSIDDITGLQSELNTIDNDVSSLATEIATKVSKPITFGEGNLAAYNSLGALIDSGKTSGDFVLVTTKGAADGVASLNAAGKVPSGQLPPNDDPARISGCLLSLKRGVGVASTNGLLDTWADEITGSLATTPGVSPVVNADGSITQQFTGDAAGQAILTPVVTIDKRSCSIFILYRPFVSTSTNNVGGVNYLALFGGTGNTVNAHTNRDPAGTGGLRVFNVDTGLAIPTDDALIGFVSNGTSLTAYVNEHSATIANPLTAGVINEQFRVGNTGSGILAAYGVVKGFWIFNRPLTASEVDSLKRHAAQEGVVFRPTRTFFVSGSSSPVGAGINGDSWVQLSQWLRDNPSVEVNSFAWGGATIPQLDAVDAFYISRRLRSYSPSTLVLHGGSNDLANGGTAASVHALVTAYVTSVRAILGPAATVIVCTVTPRFDVDMEAKRVEYNDLLRGDKAGADAIVDFDDAAPATLMDTIHPDLAYSVRMTAVIDKVLASVGATAESTGTFGTMASQDADDVEITGGTVSGISDATFLQTNTAAPPYYSSFVVKAPATNYSAAIAYESTRADTTQRWYVGSGSGGSPQNNSFRWLNITTTIEAMRLSEVDSTLNVAGPVHAPAFQTTNADGQIRLGAVLSGASVFTDAGAVRLHAQSGPPLALISELDGAILSLGINTTQVGTRDAAKVGGLFRLDTRGGLNPYFSVIRYAAGSGDAVFDMGISPSGEVTFVASVSAASFNRVGNLPVQTDMSVPTTGYVLTWTGARFEPEASSGGGGGGSPAGTVDGAIQYRTSGGFDANDLFVIDTNGILLTYTGAGYGIPAYKAMNQAGGQEATMSYDGTFSSSPANADDNYTAWSTGIQTGRAFVLLGDFGVEKFAVAADGSVRAPNHVDPIRTTFGNANGSSVVQAETSPPIVMLTAGTIVKWWIHGDVSGTVTVDVKKNGASITGTGTKPNLLVQSENSGNSFVGWAAGGIDYVEGDVFHLVAEGGAINVKEIVVVLKAERK